MNITALPPGRTCGQRWTISPFVRSVNGTGVPPVAGMRSRTKLTAATMYPSSPQLPPPTPPSGASHRSITRPPSMEIFLSFPPAKKATQRPSGEKNGASALSVPGNSVAFG